MRSGSTGESALVLGTHCRTMSSPVDRLDELPPLPRRTPTPRRTGRYVLLLVTILLFANAFVGERGLVALWRANQAHARLQLDIDTLRTENGQLHRYVEALIDEPRFIEDLARRELGMISPGEQLFIVRTPTAPADEIVALPPDTRPDKRPAVVRPGCS